MPWIYAGRWRVTSPSRFRPIGYRAGAGPQPTPGPNPNPNPRNPLPPPTVKPTAPGIGAIPGIPAPQLPQVSGPDLGAAFSGALGGVLGGGEVVLGAIVLGVGLLLLVGETRAGGEVARGARGAVRRGARAIPGLGVLA